MSGLFRIVTGGQTGVDRAALDAALALTISSGGWCPRGRLAEDGCIDPKYPLVETELTEVEQRTELNARDSDGTLILAFGPLNGGTQYTLMCAERYKKPYLIVAMDDLNEEDAANQIDAWISGNSVSTLNIAGPRESLRPGEIYDRSYQFLYWYLSRFAAGGTKQPTTAQGCPS